MSKTRFTPWIVLACIGTLAGCTSGEGGTAGNTELNVFVPNGFGNQANPGELPTPDGNNGSTPGPQQIDIQVVEYTIACNDGNIPGPFLDNGASFNDDLTLSGVLEVLDTPSAGVSNQDFGDNLTDVYVWQGFMDLPPTALCTVQLRARDGGDEVICTATEEFSITADSTTKVNVLMYCGISFQAPVGMLDLDGDFSFNVANFCPDLFVLNCIDSELDVRQPPEVPIPNVLATACQVRFRDGDSSCGGDGILPIDGGTDADGASSCDPQDCTTTPEGLDCAPRPGFVDPVVTTTVICSSTLGACAISCDGLGPEPTGVCTFTGVDLGNGVTGITGNIGDPAPGAASPGPGGFFVLCATVDDDGDPMTPEVPLTPGDDITCTATTTDGDTDCNKVKVVDLTVEGLSACQDFGGDAACSDGNVCTLNTCDNNLADPTTGCAGGICCVTDNNANDGNMCTVPPPTGGPGMCSGGTCQSTSCLGAPDPDAACDTDGNDCTFAPPGTCLADGTCGPLSDSSLGTSCDAGTGAGSGQCDGAGSCVDNCLGVDCSDGNPCTQDICTSTATPLCSNPNEPNGTACSPPAGGSCDTGVCSTPPVISDDCGNGAGVPCSTIWSAISSPPGGGVVPPTLGGCQVFVTVLTQTISLEVSITLAVDSDGANNISTGFEILVVNPLLGALGNAAELGALSINAVLTNASGGPINSGLTAAATGQPIGDFYDVPFVGPLRISSPADITVGTAAVVPTGGAGSTVDVNWDGTFTLDLTLGGMPLLTVDESICDFNVPGGPVTFAVN